jgi:hypothetical protein
MSAQVLLPLRVNSKSEQNVNSLPQLGFEPVVFGMLAPLCDHLAKSHPIYSQCMVCVSMFAHLTGALVV